MTEACRSWFLPYTRVTPCPACSLAGAPTLPLAPITGSVVLLPQIVPALRNHTPRRPLTQVWGFLRFLNCENGRVLS